MTTHDVTCLACGCLCDDLRVTVENNHISQILNACAVGETWLRYHGGNPPTDEALINGRSASLQDAINAVSEQLVRAKFPLIFGLNELDVNGQRAACALADEVGAALDSGTTIDPLPKYFPTIGAIGCTWGEVIQRADVIVYWQCDPDRLQPRHLERILDRIQQIRTVQVINDIPRDWNFETIWMLRALIQGRPAAIEPTPEVIKFAKALTAAKYSVIVHDADYPWRAALQALATDANRHTRFRLVGLAGPGNVAGQFEVMAWQTGYDRAIGFHRGHPVSAGSEFTAERLLSRGECDLAVSFGSASERLSDAGRLGLAGIQHIWVGAREMPILGGLTPAVRQIAMFTSVPGISTAGTVFRSDRICLPLRPILSTSFPDAALVLNQVLSAVRAPETR